MASHNIRPFSSVWTSVCHGVWGPLDHCIDRPVFGRKRDLPHGSPKTETPIVVYA